MKANELRIGNYLTFMEDDTVFMVNEIAETGISCSNETETTWIELDQFSGIKLTPEILEKCGFIKKVGTTANPNAIYFDFSGYRLYYSEEFISIHLDEGSWFPRLTELKYVHTFQNWYFFNTGEELECAF